MDFYSNELTARVESRHRMAELHQAARRSVAPGGSQSRERREPRGDFGAWLAKRARIGAGFMARTPSSP